ncbi:hypothetical protein ACFOMP_10220, partial [Paracoccus simplex]
MTLDSATEYALSFSEDAVHLQRREKARDGQAAGRQPAWRHLGSADFDSPAFREEFVRLRVMAGGTDADAALPVTLIIPDDQILYTTLTVAPGADRERAVGRALDGLTPYAIDDLAFDWDGDGDSVRVAAVARQTLREARDFAAQYGFAGQGYCAAPQGETYPGEPVFVLDPPQPRARPAVDLAQAGVTAAALLIEDEPPAAAKKPAAALDLDLGGDAAEAAEAGPEAAAPAAVASTGTAPAEAGAEPEAAEPAARLQNPAEPIEPAASAADQPETAPEAEQAAGTPAAGDAATPPETVATTAETVAEATAEPDAADSGPAMEEPAAAPEETAAAFTAAPAPDEPVPTPNPAAPVARQAPTAEPGGAALNPRARAFHERAA